MKIDCRLLLVVGVMIASQLQAQDTSPEPEPESQTSQEAEHEALRTLRESLTEAVLSGDVEQQIKFAHPNLVTTWQNNDVTHGFDELRELMKEMNSGDSKVFQGYTVRPETDDMAILYGEDTAIAVGRSVPHYKIMGMEFDLENRWTATLVKQDGQWLLAAYHVSGNILDNPVLTIAKNSVVWSSGVALLIGLVVGVVGTKVLSKK
jgi:hypothetical protein